MTKKRIVLLGAGYGGLIAAMRLQKKINPKTTEIVLVNKHEYHYLTTQLHEPAAGTATGESVKVDIRNLINNKKIQFIKDSVEKIDWEKKEVVLSHVTISYDYLIVGLGSEPETFDIAGLKEHALYIRSLNSARTIRTHVESMFSIYKQDLDEARLTFVVGGAGFTGVEFVGELINQMPKLCDRYDTPIDKIKIYSIEGSSSILNGFDEDLASYTKRQFENQGVIVRTSTRIKECRADGVLLDNDEFIGSYNVVWTGGVRGNRVLEKSGFDVVRGRAKVNAFLQSEQDENIFIIGDNAYLVDEQTTRPYPPTGQIATQQGMAVAENVVAKINQKTLQKFVPHIRGVVVSLGKKDAVGIVGQTKVTGFVAACVKTMVDYRYLQLLGGWTLVLKKIFK
jgi:NADH dehydrogenase